jgi:hypothetical protein
LETINKLGFLGPKGKDMDQPNVEESLSTWLLRDQWKEFFLKAACLGYAAHIDRKQAAILRKVVKQSFAKKEREMMDQILTDLINS